MCEGMKLGAEALKRGRDLLDFGGRVGARYLTKLGVLGIGEDGEKMGLLGLSLGGGTSTGGGLVG